MHIACSITKATDTHSEFVIHISFPLQQWLRELASVLCYTCSTLPVLLLSLFINLTGRFHLRNRSALNVLNAHRNSCACDAWLHIRRKKDSLYCHICRPVVQELCRSLEWQLFDYFLLGMTSRYWQIFSRRFEGMYFSHCECSNVLMTYELLKIKVIRFHRIIGSRMPCGTASCHKWRTDSWIAPLWKSLRSQSLTSLRSLGSPRNW